MIPFTETTGLKVNDDNLPSVTADPHTSLVVGGQTERVVQRPLVSLQGADEAAAVLVVHDVHGVLGTESHQQHLLAVHLVEEQVIYKNACVAGSISFSVGRNDFHFAGHSSGTDVDVHTIRITESKKLFIRRHGKGSVA